MPNKRYFVTGGTGFVGWNLIKYLQERGHEVSTMSRTDLDKNSGLKVKSYQADLITTDFAFLDEFKPDVIVHLGGISSPARGKNNQKTMDINAEATKRLLEKASTIGLESFIFMSTATVYQEKEGPLKETDPLTQSQDIYARSKIKAEEYCNAYAAQGNNITTFRLFNSYGPFYNWDRYPPLTIIPQLISEAQEKGKISVWDANPVRDFIYIGDVVRAIEKAAEINPGGIINLGTGRGTKAGELAQTIATLTGSELEFLKKPSKGPKFLVADTSLLGEKLGFKAETSVLEGLKKTINP